MILNEVIKWLILLLILILLSWLMQSMSRQRRQERERAYGSGPGQGQGRDSQGQGEPEQEDETDRWFEDAAERRRREQERKVNKIRRLLEQDPQFAQDVTRQAGTEHREADGIINDPELLKRIAEQLDDDTLDMLEVASRQPAIEMDLESTSDLEPTDGVGPYSAPGPIDNLTQIPRIRPSEWAYPPAIRNYRIVTGQAQITQFWDFVEQIKLLLVLEDWSGSMVDSAMRDGNRRWIWSRGLVIKLAKMAIAGQSRFIYRGFDGEPHRPKKVMNEEQARKFLDWAVTNAPSSGGTNIRAALERGVEDIRKAQASGEITEADILLISDGEDGSINDHEYVRELLSGIRLHVIIIGGATNEALKAVAHSYHEFH